MTFLINNLANIIVILIVAVLVILAICRLISNHKKGVHSCGYNCPGCSGSCERASRSAADKK